jgi:hypothetical protein
LLAAFLFALGKTTAFVFDHFATPPFKNESVQQTFAMYFPAQG